MGPSEIAAMLKDETGALLDHRYQGNSNDHSQEPEGVLAGDDGCKHEHRVKVEASADSDHGNDEIVEQADHGVESHDPSNHGEAVSVGQRDSTREDDGENCAEIGEWINHGRECAEKEGQR